MKFKNTVVVGIKLNEIDVIRQIDLNEISQENPYIYNLNVAPSYGTQRDPSPSTGHNTSVGNILQRSFDKMTSNDMLRSFDEEVYEQQQNNKHLRFDQLVARGRDK